MVPPAFFRHFKPRLGCNSIITNVIGLSSQTIFVLPVIVFGPNSPRNSVPVGRVYVTRHFHYLIFFEPNRPNRVRLVQTGPCVTPTVRRAHVVTLYVAWAFTVPVVPASRATAAGRRRFGHILCRRTNPY